MRQDICRIVNKLSESHATQARAAWMSGLDFSLKNAYDLILNYCKKNGRRPSNNAYEMKNGCIFANGAIVGRVAGLIDKPGYMRVAVDRVDYEDMILKRQEEVF